jgi:hypothetical protein
MRQPRPAESSGAARQAAPVPPARVRQRVPQLLDLGHVQAHALTGPVGRAERMRRGRTPGPAFLDADEALERSPEGNPGRKAVRRYRLPGGRYAAGPASEALGGGLGTGRSGPPAPRGDAGRPRLPGAARR